MPKLSSRLRRTDAEDRMTQGGGDGLGDEDGVGDEGEAEEPPGLLIQADVDSEAESEEDDDEFNEAGDGHGEQGGGGADNVENENVDEVDEPLGLLPGEEEENVEGSGRQRGGGGADGAFDGRPLPSQSQGTQGIPQTQIPEIASLPTLEEAHNTYIPTHKWPPKSVRPELARMLTSLWQRLAENPGDESVWILESIFFRCILHAGQGPDLGDQWSNVKIIKERLRRWMAGEYGQL